MRARTVEHGGSLDGSVAPGPIRSALLHCVRGAMSGTALDPDAQALPPLPIVATVVHPGNYGADPMPPFGGYLRALASGPSESRSPCK